MYGQERKKDHDVSCFFSRRIYHFDTIAATDGSGNNYFGENTFPGHDAITHLLKNGTSFVAFFPDLGNFQFCFSGNQPGTYRKTDKLNTLGGNIFGKDTWIKLKPLCPHEIN